MSWCYLSVRLFLFCIHGVARLAASRAERRYKEAFARVKESLPPAASSPPSKAAHIDAAAQMTLEVAAATSQMALARAAESAAVALERSQARDALAERLGNWRAGVRRFGGSTTANVAAMASEAAGFVWLHSSKGQAVVEVVREWL